MSKQRSSARGGAPRDPIREIQDQAKICRALGSPFYGDLLGRIAEAAASDSALEDLLTDDGSRPGVGFLPLGLLAAIHFLVLSGRAEPLARHYPSTGGQPSWPETWQLFRRTLEDNLPTVHEFLGRPPQTNEVQRSSALLVGFLEIAARTGLPLRIRELGTSAGLNLCWDRHHYQFGPHEWGPGDAGVRIEADWAGPAAHFELRPEILDRRGCDRDPIDITNDDEAVRLLAYFWPDQSERLARTRAAIETARATARTIVARDALDWLAVELQERHVGAVTVVFHTALWAYLPQETQSAISNTIQRAGAEASPDAPIAWLSADRGTLAPEIQLQMWPGGRRELLGWGHPHGHAVHWLSRPRILPD